MSHFEPMSDVTAEILLAYGINVDNFPCDVCFGGRCCPDGERYALELFKDLWEEYE